MYTKMTQDQPAPKNRMSPLRVSTPPTTPLSLLLSAPISLPLSTPLSKGALRIVAPCSMYTRVGSDDKPVSPPPPPPSLQSMATRPPPPPSWR